MAVGNNNTKLAFLAVVVCLVVAAPAAEAAITCGTVTSKLIPCLNYLRTGAGPTPACCGGVKALVAAAQTTPDRQTACACLKQTAAAVKGFSYSYAAALPGKCSVSVPYPINPSVDCSKIH